MEEKQPFSQKSRRRINRYKKIIVWGFLIATVLPSLVSIYLLQKVSDLEHDIETITSVDGGDYFTLLSSGQALASNPNVDVAYLSGEMSSEEQENEEAEPNETEQQSKRVYLTFDDGPSIYTGQILDILAANDVKATFFVIARQEDSYWPYYQRILDEGHTLGMHSYTHNYEQVYASTESFQQDIIQLSQFLEERTGVKPTIYRFPGGSSNTVMNVEVQDCIAYLNQEGITYYDWNALNGDAVSNELPPEKLVENIMADVRKNNNSIVLMHDMQSRHTTVESLQNLITTLKSEGYEILPIDENTPLIQHVRFDSQFDAEAD